MTNSKHSAEIIPLPREDTGVKEDTICIFLRDIEVPLRVGVYDREMQRPQTVRINIEMHMRLNHHFAERSAADIRHSINYAGLHGYIFNELAAAPHIPLLETVAEMILSRCLADPRVDRAEVRLEKPAVLAGTAGAGVVMTRHRRP
ncbi:MAG: FolB domain-containing protein [Alphaproteobacteria bacterium]|nr:FolB domain-containing protein [Alphaproteobacteria bacterium]